MANWNDPQPTRTSFNTSASGIPGTARTGAMDQGLRADVVSDLLEQTTDEQRTAWVVRAGHPEPHDADLHWLAAARGAFAMHGRPLEAFYAITRYGWRDVCSGRSRTWKRLRL